MYRFRDSSLEPNRCGLWVQSLSAKFSLAAFLVSAWGTCNASLTLGYVHISMKQKVCDSYPWSPPVFLVVVLAIRWRQLVEIIWAIIYFSFFCSKLGWCLLHVSKDIIYMNINPDLSKSHQFSCMTVKTPRFLNFSLLVLNCKYYLVWLILIYCQHCQPPLFWLAIFI